MKISRKEFLFRLAEELVRDIEENNDLEMTDREG